jgi:hypothetical protein
VRQRKRFSFYFIFRVAKERLDFFQKKGNTQGSIFNEKKREMIKSDIYYQILPVRSCQADVWASYHHPANGFALVFLLCEMLMVGLSDWVEYNFGRLIPYRASTARRVCVSVVRRTELYRVYACTMYVMVHRDLKPDGQRHAWLTSGRSRRL